MINALEPPLTSAATISKAVPISRESCKKSTWKTAGKSSINSVANTFPNHQCRKEKEEKKRSTPVLLTLLAFFAIQLLRESLKDPKEKSQETKAHLLLALNTKSTLLYQKNPSSTLPSRVAKNAKNYLKIIIFQPGSSETEIIPLLCHLCTTAVSELEGWNMHLDFWIFLWIGSSNHLYKSLL